MALLELPPDVRRDDERVGGGEQRRRDELAEGDDEDHHPPRDDALQKQREGDAAEHIALAAAHDAAREGQAVAELRIGRGHILNGVGEEDGDVRDDHDAERVVERQHLVEGVPEEHDADDEHDGGEHLGEHAHGLGRLVETAFSLPREGADDGAENGGDGRRGHGEEQAHENGVDAPPARRVRYSFQR